jgi:hypothetical protein
MATPIFILHQNHLMIKVNQFVLPKPMKMKKVTLPLLTPMSSCRENSGVCVGVQTAKMAAGLGARNNYGY